MIKTFRMCCEKRAKHLRGRSIHFVSIVARQGLQEGQNSCPFSRFKCRGRQLSIIDAKNMQRMANCLQRLQRPIVFEVV